MIQEYKPQNKEQAESALREIMQEVALAGLQRTGFFEKQPFMGVLRPFSFAYHQYNLSQMLSYNTIVLAG